jgi:hypothetical protein
MWIGLTFGGRTGPGAISEGNEKPGISNGIGSVVALTGVKEIPSGVSSRAGITCAASDSGCGSAGLEALSVLSTGANSPPTPSALPARTIQILILTLESHITARVAKCRGKPPWPMKPRSCGTEKRLNYTNIPFLVQFRANWCGHVQLL